MSDPKRLTPRQRVLKRWPFAYFEENSDPHKQRWFLWRDKRSHIMTEDLLGSGATKAECYKDALEKL